MAEFHETRMGQQFYDKTMPALVKQISRLADALEMLIEQRSPDVNDPEREQS